MKLNEQVRQKLDVLGFQHHVDQYATAYDYIRTGTRILGSRPMHAKPYSDQIPGLSKEGTTDSFGLSSNRLPISASAVGYCMTRPGPNFCVRCRLLHDETVQISASAVGYCTARLSKFLRPL